MSSMIECCDELKAEIEKYLTVDPAIKSYLKKSCSHVFVCTGNKNQDSQIYDYLFEAAGSDIITFDNMLQLHKLLFPNAEDAGVIRKKQVSVNESRVPIPSNELIPPLMTSLFHWINEQGKDSHPIKQAVLAQIRFAYIYPFSRGTLELAMQLTNILLIKNEFPPITVDGEHKLEYHRLLENVQGHLTEFEEFIAERVLESQTALIEKLKEKKKAEEQADSTNAASTHLMKNNQASPVLYAGNSSAIINPVYNLIKSSPGLRKEKISHMLALPVPSVEKDITALMISGLIEYRGDNSSGGYFISLRE